MEMTFVLWLWILMYCQPYWMVTIWKTRFAYFDSSCGYYASRGICLVELNFISKLTLWKDLLSFSSPANKTEIPAMMLPSKHWCTVYLCTYIKRVFWTCTCSYLWIEITVIQGPCLYANTKRLVSNKIG